MRKSMKKTRIEAHKVEGNLFEHFGLPNPEEKQAKLHLALAINKAFQRKRWTQSAAAKAIGATQPEISALKNYKLRIFSLERLFAFLMALDNDLEITIKPKPRSRASAHTIVKSEVA